MDLSVYSVDALPSVPPLPSAEQADRLAQELLAGYRSGAEAARRRYSRLHPRFERVDRSGVGATLGDARFVVAREGFDNWPRLRVAVQAAAVPPDRRVDAFLECSWAWGHWHRAQALLALQPDLAQADLYAAWSRWRSSPRLCQMPWLCG